MRGQSGRGGGEAPQVMLSAALGTPGAGLELGEPWEQAQGREGGGAGMLRRAALLKDTAEQGWRRHACLTAPGPPKATLTL